MADVAPASAAQGSSANGSAPEGKQQFVRPEKPDEEQYKEELAKAEKANAAAQEKLVSMPSWNTCDVARLHTANFACNHPLNCALFMTLPC